MTDDLIAHYRAHVNLTYPDLYDRTADALEAQARRIAELEAALKPFADMADEYDAAFPRPLNICLAEYPEDYPLWCQARTAYHGENDD